MIRRKEHIGTAFYAIGSTTEIDDPNDSSWTMWLKEQSLHVSSIERNSMNWTDERCIVEPIDVITEIGYVNVKPAR